MENKKTFNDLNKKYLIDIINKLADIGRADVNAAQKIIMKSPGYNKKLFSKSELLEGYRQLKSENVIKLTKRNERFLLDNLKKKRVRSMSGVTVVTVLTKPYPCPGECIFCPNDVRMPKSYISSEPGAQRAEDNKFDPYYQTYNRLVAYRNTGHPTGKVELLVLGGTWTSYPREYQIWFITRCFNALNDFSNQKKPVYKDASKLSMPFDEQELHEIRGVNLNRNHTYNKVISRSLRKKPDRWKIESAAWEDLFKAQKINEKSKSKCVGLVIETRPDEISKEEIIRFRRLGATKVQLGIQSLNPEVLKKNKRGHNVITTRKSFDLLRSAGFKIHGHWMPNLYGSNVQMDKSDYKKLFDQKFYRPDELKIYPCTLVNTAELMKYYKKKAWKPYSYTQLNSVLGFAMLNTPGYCRITRVVRDIPSGDIVSGNKKTNFRQIAEKNIKSGYKLQEIRSREIKDSQLNLSEVKMKITPYETSNTREYFLEYVTAEDKIAGFLRLSLPLKPPFIRELSGSSIIREVHVYGQSLDFGETKKGKAQHMGLGKSLIKEAEKISRNQGFLKISVISAVGTRGYYAKLGYKRGALYQFKKLV